MGGNGKRKTIEIKEVKTATEARRIKWKVRIIAKDRKKIDKDIEKCTTKNKRDSTLIN